MIRDVVRALDVPFEDLAESQDLSLSDECEVDTDVERLNHVGEKSKDLLGRSREPLEVQATCKRIN